MRDKDRLTEKKVAAQILPKITEARGVLASHLTSLRYLWEKVDKHPPDQQSMDEFQLRTMAERLQQIEDELCRM